MANFRIVYHHDREKYFEPSKEDRVYTEVEEGMDFYQGIEQAEDPMKAFYEKLRKIKSTLIFYFEYMVKKKIKPLENSEELVAEMKVLLETWANDIDFTPNHSTGFLEQSDEYFCFNNVENFITAADWARLGDNAEIYHTIVLIDKKFTKFCFVTTTSYLSNPNEETAIKVFEVEGKKVHKKMVKFEGGFDLTEYTKEEIEHEIQSTLAMRRKSE